MATEQSLAAAQAETVALQAAADTKVCFRGPLPLQQLDLFVPVADAPPVCVVFPCPRMPSHALACPPYHV